MIGRDIGQGLRQSIFKARETSETFHLSGSIDVPLDLSGALIGHLDARGARFRAPVNFSGARFAGVAWFDEASFDTTADFSNATFDFDARFDDATFNGDALFIETEFNGIAAFDKAVFQSLCALDRSICFGNLSVGEAEFEQSCSLRGVTCLGGLWCDRTRFASLDMSELEVQGRYFIRGATVSSGSARLSLVNVLRGNWYAYGHIRA